MENNFDDFLSAYQAIKAEGIHSFAVVTLVETRGSTPQHQGARIIATQSGLYFGTIGGGKVEAQALLKVSEHLLLLKSGDTKKLPLNFFVKWNLQQDVGMTCGGEVSLFFEFHLLDHPWTIVIFGAGHVSLELNWLLQKIDCKVICIDPRQEWLNKLPKHDRLKTICTEEMPLEVAKLSEKYFIVLMTMGHSTDFPILKEVIKKNFPYVGVIGSDTKAIKIKRELTELGFSQNDLEKYVCPIGEKFGNNSPVEIAVSVLAQLLSYRDKIKF